MAARIICAIGYAVYFLLWSPVVVTVLLIAPIVYVYIGKKKHDMTIRESWGVYMELLRAGFKHDIDFILGKSDW